MESTPMEEKLRQWLLNHTDGTLGSTLYFVQKVYADMPRDDIKAADFPRLRVIEEESPGKLVHQTSIYEYEAHLDIEIFVNMDKPRPLVSGEGNVAPEVMCARIGYIIIDLMDEKWEEEWFGTGDPLELRIRSYKRLGIDDDYFSKLNVYKGRVSITGTYWR